MSYPRSMTFGSVISLLWLTICLGADELFGKIDFLKEHFKLLIPAVISLSFLPIIISALQQTTPQLTLEQS